MTGRIEAHGLVMDWRTSINQYGTPVVRGYIGSIERLACQVFRREVANRQKIEAIVTRRLAEIAAEG